MASGGAGGVLDYGAASYRQTRVVVGKYGGGHQQQQHQQQQMTTMVMGHPQQPQQQQQMSPQLPPLDTTINTSGDYTAYGSGTSSPNKAFGINGNGSNSSPLDRTAATVDSLGDSFDTGEVALVGTPDASRAGDGGGVEWGAGGGGGVGGGNSDMRMGIQPREDPANAWRGGPGGGGGGRAGVPAAASSPFNNSNGNPVGYQVAGRGFAAPRVAANNSGSKAAANLGPPVSTVKTKPKKPKGGGKKKKSGSKGSNKQQQIEQNGSFDRNGSFDNQHAFDDHQHQPKPSFESDQPFDCSPGRRSTTARAAAAVAAAAASTPPPAARQEQAPPSPQRPQRQQSPLRTRAQPSAPAPSTSAAANHIYERMYYSESEQSDAVRSARSVPVQRRGGSGFDNDFGLAAVKETTPAGGMTSPGPAGTTNPFEDDFVDDSKAPGPADDLTIETGGTSESWKKAEEEWRKAEAVGDPGVEYDTALDTALSDPTLPTLGGVESSMEAEARYRQAAAVVGGGGSFSTFGPGDDIDDDPVALRVQEQRLRARQMLDEAQLAQLDFGERPLGGSQQRRQRQPGQLEQIPSDERAASPSHAGGTTTAVSASATAAAAASGTTKSILKPSTRRRSHPWDLTKANTRSTDASVRTDNDSLFDFQEHERVLAEERAQGRKKDANAANDKEKKAGGASGLRKSRSHDSGITDRRMQSVGRSRLRGGRGSASYDDDDESTAVGPTLQDRSQQAWSRKKGGRGEARAQADGSRSKSAPRLGRDEQAPSSKGAKKKKRAGDRSSVAFTGKDAVHHFDEESTVYTDTRGGTVSDDDTFYSRRTTATADSTYTKTYESEVEDLVKDFFFVGNGSRTVPGKRRNKADFAEKVEKHEKAYKDEESTFGPDDVTYEESTLMSSTYAEESTLLSKDSGASVSETVESEDNTVEPPTSKKHPSRKKKDDDASVDTARAARRHCEDTPCEMDENPLTAVWEFMEGGLDAVTEALGLSDPKSQKAKVSSTSRSGDGSEKDGNTTSNSSKKSSTTENKSALGGFMEYASDLLYTGGPSNETGGSLDTDTYGLPGSMTLSQDSEMEKEAGLVELSICAARAKHLTSGASFNDKAEIDVVNDIKFNVITTSLPLGLLFQENSAGCWVAKVFSSGNAAKAASGKGVEVGDQLAAVNGNSTIKLTVDEVCDMISSAPRPEEIELTFLRYIGPLHTEKGAMDSTPVRRTGSGLGKLHFPLKRNGSNPKGASSPKRNLSQRISTKKSHDSAAAQPSVTPNPENPTEDVSATVENKTTKTAKAGKKQTKPNKKKSWLFGRGKKNKK